MKKQAKKGIVVETGKNGSNGASPLEITIVSFGYKQGPPPTANVMFDVRFLKNPYWIEELRPLCGLDQAVQKYVLDQPAANEFLSSLVQLIQGLVPRLIEMKIPEFTIALGCTGGQHRSATLVEALAQRLESLYPEYKIKREHRELDLAKQANLELMAED